MKHALILLTAPRREPISVEECQSHLRLPEEVEASDIEKWIVTARQYFEEHDDRRLIAQQYEMSLSDFPAGTGLWAAIALPLRPILSVDLIRYRDKDGMEQEIQNDDYQLDLKSFHARIAPLEGKAWPDVQGGSFYPVGIQFTAGYEDDSGYAQGIPEHLKTALLMHVGHLYENREATVMGNMEVTEIPMGYRALIGAHRHVKV